MKTITISAERTLKSISEEFNTKFPYLKLRFYSKPHEAGTLTSDTYLLASELTIQEAGTFDHTQTISIDGHTKVSTLERTIQEIFGIGAQVLRRSSGGIWLQTSTTDEWTLTKQNREGEIDSMPIRG